MFYTIHKQIGFLVRTDVNARAQAAIYVSYNTALDLIAILKDWQYFQIKSPCIYEVLCFNYIATCCCRKSFLKACQTFQTAP